MCTCTANLTQPLQHPKPARLPFHWQFCGGEKTDCEKRAVEVAMPACGRRGGGDALRICLSSMVRMVQSKSMCLSAATERGVAASPLMYIMSFQLMLSLLVQSRPLRVSGVYCFRTDAPAVDVVRMTRCIIGCRFSSSLLLTTIPR